MEELAKGCLGEQSEEHIDEKSRELWEWTSVKNMEKGIVGVLEKRKVEQE